MWNSRAADPDTIMLWAAVTTCFFGFFRAGEITVPSAAALNPAVHLAWGDVAINNPWNPTLVVIHLEQSKCDQFGDGVDVCDGCTGDELCPVVAVTSYIARRGGEPGAHSRGQAVDKSSVCSKEHAAGTAGSRSVIGCVYGAQLPHRRCHDGCSGRASGFHHSDVGSLEQCCFSIVHPCAT